MNNKILNLSLLIICLFSIQTLCAQKSIKNAINSAIDKETKTGNFYIANISENKNLDVKTVEKYCTGIYAIKNIKTKDRQMFGAVKTVVISFEFRDLEEIRQEEIAAEIRRKELAKSELARREREKIEVEKKRVEFEAAEKIRKEEEKIALEKEKKNKVKIVEVNSNTNSESKQTNSEKNAYSQNEFPKTTKLSEGIWGKTKVEYKKYFYYIIDNRWDDSDKLSCYDRCYSCGLGGMSNKEVDIKKLSMYCEGKLMDEFLIKEISACYRTFYSHNGSNSFRDSEFNSEYDAITNLINIKSKECNEGDAQKRREKRDEQEKKMKILKDEEMRLRNEKRTLLFSQYEAGLIVPDIRDYENYELRKNSIPFSEIVKYKWQLKEVPKFGLDYQIRKIEFRPNGDYFAIIQDTEDMQNDTILGKWEIAKEKDGIVIFNEARPYIGLDGFYIQKEKITFSTYENAVWIYSTDRGRRFWARKIDRVIPSDKTNIPLDITGTWNLIGMQLKTAFGGVPTHSNYKIKIKIVQSENIISGRLISIMKGNFEGCAMASLSGTINNGKFIIEIKFDSDCCKGLIGVFTGHMVEDNIFYSDYIRTSMSSDDCYFIGSSEEICAKKINN